MSKNKIEDLHSFVPTGVDRTSFKALLRAAHGKNIRSNQREKLYKLAAVVCISDTSQWSSKWKGIAPSMLVLCDWFIGRLADQVRELLANYCFDSDEIQISLPQLERLSRELQKERKRILFGKAEGSTSSDGGEEPALCVDPSLTVVSLTPLESGGPQGGQILPFVSPTSSTCSSGSSGSRKRKIETSLQSSQTWC